jgi:citrate lyase beta subunit
MLRSSMRPRRSILSMPADSPRFHVKAEGIPADEVIFDLEDSVVQFNKDAARRQLFDSLSAESFKDRTVAVRVNSLTSRWIEKDLEAAVQCGRVDSLVIPKVGSSDDILYIEQRLGVLGRRLSLEPQIETAAGLVHAAEIAAASPHVEALHFGPLDMAASIGMPISGSTMVDDVYQLCLFQVLVAARASGKQVIDGPYTLIADQAGLQQAIQRAVRLGYDGKWAIHPDQVGPINKSFTPKKADQTRAQSILDAYRTAKSRGTGAIALKGEMLDEAVVRWAEATMARAGGSSPPSETRRTRRRRASR